MKTHPTTRLPARFRAAPADPKDLPPAPAGPQTPPAVEEPLFEPFPKPNTIPSGWDLSDLPARARGTRPFVHRRKQA